MFAATFWYNVYKHTKHFLNNLDLPKLYNLVQLVTNTTFGSSLRISEHTEKPATVIRVLTLLAILCSLARRVL